MKCILNCPICNYATDGEVFLVKHFIEQHTSIVQKTLQKKNR